VVLKRPSLSLQITIGLLAGLAFGLAATATGEPTLRGIAVAVEPIGTLWVNLIRMVVIPLVVAAVVAGVAGLGGAARLGRLGMRSLAVFLGLGLLGVLFGLALGLFVLPLAPLSADATAALRAAATSGGGGIAATAGRLPGVGQFLVDLVPTNPLRAATDGALLPVIVFSVLFGAATAGLPDEKRAAITDLADAVMAAMIRLIGWFMVVAPIGVACLVAPVAARLGLEMVARLGLFIGVLVGGYVAFTVLVLAPVVRLAVRLPVRRFAVAVTPAWAIGFSTTSSMAALPAMLEVATADLRISRPLAGFVLPLAATLNRPGSGFYQAVAALFVAQLYGVALDAPQVAALGGTLLVLTLSVAAIPRGTVLSLAPALLAVGLPLDGIGLLIGVDQVPDMFRTATNVAGHLTATGVVARAEGEVLA
jgi:Na+/H+-dicarboxylate symporter